MKNQILSSSLIEISARWYAAAMISLYAIGKLTNGQFYHKGKLPPEIAQKTVDQLGAFELAWTFFGYSQNYILFIGLSQLLGALMLLNERSKLLGVAVLMPIMINIVVVDAEFGVGPAIMSAIFYSSLLILILLMNRQKVWNAFKQLTIKANTGTTSTLGSIIRIGIILGLLVGIFFLETLLLKVVGANRFS
jgi:hypothetical protein